MNRFLKIFSKDGNTTPFQLFETTLEQQLEFDARHLNQSTNSVKTSDTTSTFKPNIPIVAQKFICFFRTQCKLYRLETWIAALNFFKTQDDCLWSRKMSISSYQIDPNSSCITIVETPGMFRTTGSLAKVKQFKQLMTHKTEIATNDIYDIQAIASCFKLWLRELSDGVVPKNHFEAFLNASGKPDEMKAAIDMLPRGNRATLGFICQFLKEMASHSTENLMNPTNLSIVFGPCLIRITAEDSNISMVMKETLKTNDIVKQIIENYDFLFGEDGNYSNASSPLMLNEMTPTNADFAETPTFKSVAAARLEESIAMKENVNREIQQSTANRKLAHLTHSRSRDHLRADSSESVSSITSPAMSPLSIPQKLELSTTVADTIQDIIQGSSPSQKRNQLMASISVEDKFKVQKASKGAKEEDQMETSKERTPKMVPRQHQSLQPPKKIESKESLSRSPSSIRPPNRTAPIASLGLKPSRISGTGSSSSVASEIWKETEIKKGGSHSNLGSGNRNNEIRSLKAKTSHPHINTASSSTESTNGAMSPSVKSPSSLTDLATPKAKPQRPTAPLPASSSHHSSIIAINSPSDRRHVANRSEPSLATSPSSTIPAPPTHNPPSPLKMASSGNLLVDTHHLPIINQTSGHTRKTSSNVTKEAATPIIPATPILSPTSAMSMSDSPSALKYPIVEMPSSPVDSNILEVIRNSDIIPSLAEMSKADIHLTKIAFKALHTAVHDKSATPAQLSDYKRMKKVIKFWQTNGAASSITDTSSSNPQFKSNNVLIPASPVIQRSSHLLVATNPLIGTLSASVSGGNKGLSEVRLEKLEVSSIRSGQSIASKSMSVIPSSSTTPDLLLRPNHQGTGGRSQQLLNNNSSSASNSNEQIRLKQDIKELSFSVSDGNLLGSGDMLQLKGGGDGGTAPKDLAYENLKSRKKQLQHILHTYQKTFENENGRPIKTSQDIGPLLKEYTEYRSIKKDLLKKE